MRATPDPRPIGGGTKEMFLPLCVGALVGVLLSSAIVLWVKEAVTPDPAARAEEIEKEQGEGVPMRECGVGEERLAVASPSPPSIDLPAPDPLSVFLGERPGSPLALFEPELAAQYLPSREALERYAKVVEGAEVIWDAETIECWTRMREFQVLKRFIGEHEERTDNIPLRHALGPVYPWLTQRIDWHNAELDSLVDHYDSAVYDGTDTSDARWALNDALNRAAKGGIIADLLNTLKRGTR